MTSLLGQTLLLITGFLVCLSIYSLVCRYEIFKVIRQVAAPGGEAGLVSNPIIRYMYLLQICQRDKAYDSYVEMPISCRSSVANFTHVTAAALVSPGADVSRRFGDHLLLAAAFHSHSPGVASGSALCVFRMSDVRARAADNVRKCRSTASVEVGTQFYRPGAASHYCTRSQVAQVNH